MNKLKHLPVLLLQYQKVSFLKKEKSLYKYLNMKLKEEKMQKHVQKKKKKKIKKKIKELKESSQSVE